MAPIYNGVEVSHRQYRSCKAREYYYLHREQQNASSKRYWDRNREALNARRREKYSSSPSAQEKEKARTKEYLVRNPWMVSFQRARRTSKERQIIFDLTIKDARTLWTLAAAKWPQDAKLTLYRKDPRGPYSVQNCDYKPRMLVMSEAIGRRWVERREAREAPAMVTVEATACEECGLTGKHHPGCSEAK